MAARTVENGAKGCRVDVERQDEGRKASFLVALAHLSRGLLFVSFVVHILFMFCLGDYAGFWVWHEHLTNKPTFPKVGHCISIYICIV